MEKEFKSGFAALIGRPNVGKSTLMNHLIGQKIAITSEKPQTTRRKIRTMFTDDRGQIIFLDTPGMHQPRSRLGEYMTEAAESTLSEADVILWLVEPGAFIGTMDAAVLEKLSAVKRPVILVINKSDKAEEAVLRKTEETYRAQREFADCIYLSALKSVNTDALIAKIFELLPVGPQYYDEEQVTDEPMRDIAAEIIREKALRNLSEEIPHGIAVTVEQMTEREDGGFDIFASIICERDSHKGIIIGKGGSMLKKIGMQARRDISAMCDAPVNLRLFVKVRKDWRDNRQMLKNFGYSENKRNQS